MTTMATSARRAVTARDIERSVLGALAATAVLSALASLFASHLLCNCTPSLPLGLYWLSRSGHVTAGALVAFPVPRCVQELVRERGYLPPGALLVKPVVALPDDRVCTDGGALTVNGAPFGPIATEDTRGRPLPHPERCGPLPDGFAFVASPLPTSFDSRTFGPVPLTSIRATVTPLWTY